MSAVEQLLLAYFANACWQLPVVAGLAALVVRTLVRQRPAAVEHSVWLIAAMLVGVVPWGVLLGLAGPVALGDGGVPGTGSRTALGIFLAAAATSVVSLARRAASPRPAGPSLTGIWRPVIALPPYMHEPSNSHLLAASLAHEYAHIERRDMLTFALTEIVLCPVGWHPAARWLRARLASARERACDDLATQGGDRVGYARALLEVASRAVQERDSGWAIGIGDGDLLEERIRALLDRERKRPPTRLRIGAALLLGCFAASGLLTSSVVVYRWVSALPSPVLAARAPKPPPAPKGPSRAGRR